MHSLIIAMGRPVSSRSATNDLMNRGTGQPTSTQRMRDAGNISSSIFGESSTSYTEYLLCNLNSCVPENRRNSRNHPAMSVSSGGFCASVYIHAYSFHIRHEWGQLPADGDHLRHLQGRRIACQLEANVSPNFEFK